jgi:hypothetical protein
MLLNSQDIKGETTSLSEIKKTTPPSSLYTSLSLCSSIIASEHVITPAIAYWRQLHALPSRTRLHASIRHLCLDPSLVIILAALLQRLAVSGDTTRPISHGLASGTSTIIIKIRGYRLTSSTAQPSSPECWILGTTTSPTGTETCPKTPGSSLSTHRQPPASAQSA